MRELKGRRESAQAGTEQQNASSAALALVPAVGGHLEVAQRGNIRRGGRHRCRRTGLSCCWAAQGDGGGYTRVGGRRGCRDRHGGVSSCEINARGGQRTQFSCRESCRDER